MPEQSASIDPPVASETRRGVLIGVCTLNEAANITPLIARLREAVPAADILIVDDDSEDNTAGLVAQIAEIDPAVRLVVRTDQRGLGSAIRAAMNYAIQHDYALFLNLDGDLSHDPGQLPTLLQRALQSPQVDVVIGSRYAPGGTIVGWPIHRRWISRMVNGFARLCLRLPVTDCSGSMRCYRVDALSRLGMSRLHSNGYAVLEELLVMLRRQNAEMTEVPITFTDRRLGKSKLTLGEAIRSTVQILAMAIKR